MPATDWREITFSRSRLRPHDGLDPTVKRLKEQCKELSRKKTIDAYSRAKTLLEECEDRKRQCRIKLKKEELSRQEEERRKFADAFKLRLEAFNAEWEHRRAETEKKCAQRVRDFEDKADAQLTNLEKHLEKTPMPPVKYSSVVRDDRTIEHKNANAGSFELAMRYNKSLQGQMKIEEETHAKEWAAKVERKRQALQDRLESERRNLLDACDRIRYAFEFQHKVALERLHQTQKNLKLDVEHALSLEFIQRQEVRKSLMSKGSKQKSYASRPKTSSTFMGRNMMESAGRGSRDVMSVCKMEFDIPDTPRFPTSEQGRRPRTTGGM
mmetsp:Transcript_68383/g.142556  ORF Transcript_68383/g.142556 Transcript_68383/m.142556 type:complete len:325 (+) Transcript_68383:222-1196(+)|eukprot:CAMPEP_0181301402 /NCGR_PEP_ID=MMETSP1101-20121128/7405_1 /TAXON_ID=46948 /ORGANISM="Rhodomonas abbreviata, Strain Caron Lab Isolate" /LENGTH=324 /DNA_ID=CAMNT_0023406705 /DNA_START=218 /DNA_END=1192 /DNA_ORIENTATION=-